MYQKFCWFIIETTLLVSILAGTRKIWFFISSNINEVINIVLNSLLFFYENILHAQKSTKKHKKAPRARKTPKSTKNATKQKHKNANK